MKTNTRYLALIALGAVSCGATRPAAPAKTELSAPHSTTRAASAIPDHDVERIRPALGRLSFGPRPGEAERVAELGFETWLDRQLAPASASDPELERALGPYRGALEPPLSLLERFGDPERSDPEANERPLRQRLKEVDFKQVIGSVAMAELTRHVLSEREVEEVMVDFWTNHFNVFARKGLVRLFAGDYVERALRPNALGRFSDLLLATARHPAMLVYLDNARSVVKRGDRPRGLNENYARELLELHTLGVDGGYSQKDVTEVARVLTGWSVRRPREGGPDFVFRERAHDRGEKTVLGVKFPAGHGEDEGLTLLSMLAEHPATARHLAHKLCARFVADDPPKECLDAATKAYLESHGEIRSVIRAIVAEPSFWAAAGADTKLKTPLEYVTSSLRALGASPDGTLGLAKVLGRLGEPMLLEQVPTGYPEAESEWLGSSGMLARMNYATALANGRLPGASLDLDRAIAPNLEPRALVERTTSVLLGKRDAQLEKGVLAELAGVDDPASRRTLAVALVLGSPEFQRQ